MDVRALARTDAGGPAAASGTRSGLWVSVLLCAVVAPAVLYGSSLTAYRGYARDVVVGSRAQDVFTLLVLPALVWTSVRARRGALAAHVAWLGLLFYLGCLHAIYLIGWQQNRAFLLYVGAVTLAVTALLDGIARFPGRQPYAGYVLALTVALSAVVAVGLLMFGDTPCP